MPCPRCNLLRMRCPRVRRDASVSISPERFRSKETALGEMMRPSLRSLPPDVWELMLQFLPGFNIGPFAWDIYAGPEGKWEITQPVEWELTHELQTALCRIGNASPLYRTLTICFLPCKAFYPKILIIKRRQKQRRLRHLIDEVFQRWNLIENIRAFSQSRRELRAVGRVGTFLDPPF